MSSHSSFVAELTLPPTQDRYHSLREMIRQWQHLTLLKRAGIGHNIDGVAAVRPGILALLCPACPQFGINTVDMADDERYHVPYFDIYLG